MARIRRLTGGRAWVARLSALVVLAAIVALIVAVVPVLAGHADVPPSSGATVTPSLVGLGGESGDCDDPQVAATGEFELRIENPQPGASVSANHGAFTVTFTIIDVYNIDKEGWKGEAFSWSIDAAGTDLIVKGGSSSAHYDYVDLAHGLGTTVSGDFDNHATAQNKKRLHSVSHATVCYDVVATISGLKWHDHDQNGEFGGSDPDDAVESVIKTGWTINLYEDGNPVPIATTTTSLLDGSYSFPGLPIGETYIVCEDPPDGQWSQKDVGGTWDPDACSGAGEEEGGHVITLQGDATADFGNFITVDAMCGDTISDPTGEHNITLPSDPGLCSKPDTEYVLETYNRVSGELIHDFHPLGGFLPTEVAHVTEVHVWSIDQIQNSSTLMYDDGAGPLEAEYCNHDPRPLTAASVVGLLPSGETTCIIESTEGPTAAGDDVRTDVLYSLIDGRRWV